MDGRTFRASDIAVATAVEQAANTPQRQAERRARSYNVGNLPGRELVFSQPNAIGNPVADKGPERPAIKHQAAVPETEDFPNRGELFVVLQDKHNAGADNAADEDPDREILQHFFRDALAPRQANCQDRAKDEGEKEHRAVAVHGDVGQDVPERFERHVKKNLAHELEPKVAIRAPGQTAPRNAPAGSGQNNSWAGFPQPHCHGTLSVSKMRCKRSSEVISSASAS